MSAAASIDTDCIFADFELTPRKALIVAVSGGSDSLALLLCLQAFLRKAASTVRPVAVTVDHGLRPAAAQEAEYVASVCRDVGISHRVMRWEGVKPRLGIPAAAREARYELLAEAAVEAETDLLFTGHTLDDQLETVAMREARGDGRGLAGMAPATLFNGKAWILRPLLNTRRAALRAFLGECGVGWIDDPTNVDQGYERPRIRAGLTERDHVTLLRDAAGAADERIRLGQMAAVLIERHAAHVAPGLLRLDPRFASEASDAARYALRMLLAVTGGTTQLPDAERVLNLFGKLTLPKHRATLSRTVVDVRRAGIFLHRERRGLPEPSVIDRPVIWDGRYLIEPQAGTKVRVELSGQADVADRDLPVAASPESLVRAAYCAQPATLPVTDGFGSRQTATLPILAPWLRFLPSFDLAPAAAIAKLVGAKPVPQPPFTGHNNQRG